MFSYYGSKSKIIQYYPSPKYNTIIEPFAGSARYSLMYYEKDCWLNDSYKVITDIWNWIINATKEEINAIPELKKGESLNKLNIDPKLKLLLGFVVNSGVQSPRKTCSKWAEEKGEFIKHKKRLLSYCGKLDHWLITGLDYRDISNLEATWFIDPPYQFVTEKYKKHDINYEELTEWCKSRKEQVIVCENSYGNWLPFKPLKELYGQRHKTMEMMWYKE